jgi:hypothetical protein
MVALPKSVEVKIDGERLKLIGTVSLAERRALRAALAGVPYLPVDFSGLNTPDQLATERMRVLQRELQALRIPLQQNVVESAQAETSLRPLKQLVEEYQALNRGKLRLTLVMLHENTTFVDLKQREASLHSIRSSVDSNALRVEFVWGEERVGLPRFALDASAAAPIEIAISKIEVL